MTVGNFNWFMHTMLFMHTLYVIQKQEAKKEKVEDGNDEGDVDTDVQNE
jgi:hypothetical protein